jgi:CubicO group peptidase (beta-lactamase class C family)
MTFVNEFNNSNSQLLTNTVGLGVDTADPDLQRWSTSIGRTATYLDWTIEGFTTPLKFAPGDGWYYGTATDWIGQVIERLTSQKLSAYVQSHILDPLGMRDTGFWPDLLPHVADRTAEYTFRENAILKPGPSPVPKEHPIECAGSGLFSTAADYAKVLQAVLGDRLVSSATTDAIFTPQLNEAQKSMLNTIAHYFQDMFAPGFSEELELDWGLGAMLHMQDEPGKRHKGSLTWSGNCNGRWVSLPSP